VSRSVHLIILTLMLPKGTTGVQTHFNAIADYARAGGLKVSVICPHQYNRWIRKVPGAIGLFLNLISRETAVQVDRFFCRILLRSLLNKVLVDAQVGDEMAVVYAQDPWSARVALDLRQEGYRFRLVGVVHFNISEAQEYAEKGIASKYGWLWRSLQANERVVLPKLDQVIFVSGFMQHVVSARLPELSYVPQAVISNFPLSIESVGEGTDTAPSDIIAIGTLEPRKNQRFLLDILAECRAMGKRYNLTLVGDGPDRSFLEHEAERLGLSDQVRFFGYQPAAARFISGCRAFVHCSKMESQGIVLIEALRSAVPVFAAPVGGIPEVFEDGGEGHYLDLNDPHDAALKLVSVLENRHKWQRMSARAYETFSSRFHPDVLGPHWINTLIAG
jgi:glycosyltransferase involved in cell wall biosynthesis